MCHLMLKSNISDDFRHKSARHRVASSSAIAHHHQLQALVASSGS
jgi:hypothetical protein